MARDIRLGCHFGKFNEELTITKNNYDPKLYIKSTTWTPPASNERSKPGSINSQKLFDINTKDSQQQKNTTSLHMKAISSRLSPNKLI
jgi:hypothetical protein